jgi:hypothetical protein
MFNIKRLYKDEGSVSIGDLMNRVRDLEAAVKADFVHGILGLHRPSTDDEEILQLIRPDYSKTTGEVFWDASRYSIMESSTDNLYALGFVHHRDETGLHTDDYPSWAWMLTANGKER